MVAPNIPAKGEIKTKMQLFQQQLAQTMADLLGKKFKANHTVAEGLIDVLK